MTKRRKSIKFLALGLILVMLFSILINGPSSGSVYAAEVWIEISDEADLNSIRDDLFANYVLKADIDLNGASWVPIGSSATPFTGKLNGNSKVIRNFVINDTSANETGFFAAIGSTGEVKNLGIEETNIIAGDNAGILAGVNNGTVEQTFAKGSVTGQLNVGGLVGTNETAGKVINSFASAYVAGKGSIGGLIGLNNGNVDKSYSSSEVANSIFNNYLQFDGDGDYISIPHIADYNTDKFTLEAWFQWDNVDTADVQFIVGKGFEQYEIHTGGGSGINGVRFIPIPHDEQDSWIDANNVMKSGWFHVAAVYDYVDGVAEAKVYINGIAQDLNQKGSSVGTTASMERAYNPLTENTEDFNIGSRAGGSSYFKGKISDVRFWNTARTAEEIVADKDRQLTGGEEELIGYWKLNEEEGNPIDSTGKNLTSSLFGDITRVKEVPTDFGGLVGNNTGTVSNSHYDLEVSGQNDDTEKGSPQITNDMKAQETFTDWDFDGIWGIDVGVNDGYPYLLSTIATVSSGSYTVSTGGTAGETITNVPEGISKATFLADLIKGEENQTWDDSLIADPVIGGNTLVVTAQDGTTVVTYTIAEFADGDGQPGNPYQISKLEHLNGIRNHLDSHFILLKDLDFGVDSDYEDINNKTIWTTGNGWVPIGDVDLEFTGVFDADGYSISNLMVNRAADYQGLFGVAAAGSELKNGILKALNISGTTIMGGLVGENKGLISNFGSEGNVIGRAVLGGLVGKNEGQIFDSYSSVTVTASNPIDVATSIGGLVGFNNSSSVLIENSYASGNVTATNTSHDVRWVGGLVGFNNGGGKISKSYATGDVTATSDSSVSSIGGLVGAFYGLSTSIAEISDSYALGAVTGKTEVGGLIGAGLDASISTSYSAGLVSGTADTGGLLGKDFGSTTVNSSYYNGETSGQSDTGKGQSVSTEEMKVYRNLAGLGFLDVWDQVDTETHDSYPFFEKQCPKSEPGIRVKASPSFAIGSSGGWTGASGLEPSRRFDGL